MIQSIDTHPQNFIRKQKILMIIRCYVILFRTENQWYWCARKSNA